MFKGKADRIIKERYGIEVEHIHARVSYEEQFYKVVQKGKATGNIYGFPMVRGSPALGSLVGDIYEIGFICDGGSAGASIS